MDLNEYLMSQRDANDLAATLEITKCNLEHRLNSLMAVRRPLFTIA